MLDVDKIINADFNSNLSLDNQIKKGIELMLAKILVNAHSTALDINLLNFKMKMSKK